MVAEPLDGEQPRDVLRQEPKDVRMVDLPHEIHLALAVALVRRHVAPQRRRERAPVRCLGEQARIEQLVEQDRMPGEVLGGP